MFQLCAGKLFHIQSYKPNNKLSGFNNTTREIMSDVIEHRTKSPTRLPGLLKLEIRKITG